MNTKTIKIILFIIALSILLPLVSSATTTTAQKAQNMRIGLRFGMGALGAVPSANLRNVEGFGNGFQFGHFNNEREFVPIGARTSHDQITILMDRNMVWHPASTADGFGEYREGSSGGVVVGAFHIQLNRQYDSFDAAREEANAIEGGFVKYDSGRFFVSVGHFTSREAAANALSARGFSGTAEINSGTAQTVTVTVTGSSTILFEYENGSTPLGIMPVATDGGNPETWFRGHRYHGGFQFARLDDAMLTVVNFVGMEDYVKGVIPYEMGNMWPLEALKAQAVCARSYAQTYRGRHSSHSFDICDTIHCQVYRGRANASIRSDQASEETAEMYMIHYGEVVRGYYSASNGGASENSENVWNDALPYLRGVIDPYEAEVASRMPEGYEWRRTRTPEQIASYLRGRGHSISGSIVSLRISEFTPTGNVLSVTATDGAGRQFTISKREQLIGALGIRTQRFTIGNVVWDGSIFVNDPAQSIGDSPQYFAINDKGEVTSIAKGAMYAITGTGAVQAVTGGGTVSGGTDVRPSNGVFTMTGWGNGHNVGMSQWGAYSMAHYHDKTYIDILTFYYTDVTIGPLP